MTKRLTKPSKAARDSAWRALHAIAADPDAGDTARVSAARALIRDDPEQREAEDAAVKASRGRPAIISLPDNGRSPPGTPLGITRSGDDGCYMIIYDCHSEQGLADWDRWLAEVAAKIEADYPSPPPLLAPPAPKPKLTEAERKRAYRARIAARAAAMALTERSDVR
jgi:hypothetical protein